MSIRFLRGKLGLAFLLRLIDRSNSGNLLLYHPVFQIPALGPIPETC